MRDIAKRCAALHAACFAAEQAWSAESFESLLRKPHVHFMAHEQGGHMLGLALFSIAVDEMELLTIAVDPSHQRRGMGASLMRQGVELARANHLAQLFLEVDADNRGAIRCYEHAGFVTIATRKDYYKTANGRSDALVMQCPLSP